MPRKTEVRAEIRIIVEAQRKRGPHRFRLHGVTGFFSWIVLVWGRHRDRAVECGYCPDVATITFVLMVRAAYMAARSGIPKRIQHGTLLSSLRSDTGQVVGSFRHGPFLGRPQCETLHFGRSQPVVRYGFDRQSRLLGIGKTMLSFAALRQLLPLGMIGFR